MVDIVEEMTDVVLEEMDEVVEKEMVEVVEAEMVEVVVRGKSEGRRRRRIRSCGWRGRSDDLALKGNEVRYWKVNASLRCLLHLWVRMELNLGTYLLRTFLPN